MTTNDIMQDIIQGDLQTLWNILSKDKHQTPQLTQAYNKVKNGIKLNYHIEWNLRELHNVRARAQEIELNGTIYNIEDWWDEEKAREDIARQALEEHYGNNDVYEGR